MEQTPTSVTAKAVKRVCRFREETEVCGSYPTILCGVQVTGCTSLSSIYIKGGRLSCSWVLFCDRNITECRLRTTSGPLSLWSPS